MEPALTIPYPGPMRMTLGIGMAFLVLGIQLIPAAAAASIPLPRSTPEKQGASSVGLLRFIDALDRIDQVHSVMILRHGKVIIEGWWSPYDAATPHEMYSLSKSFTSTAVGLAIGEGRFSVDDPVLKWFPEDAPPQPSANLRAMRVRDLLTMSTGHQDEPPTAPGVVSAKSFLAQPVPHKPGTHFKYNTASTFMQSALVQKASGQTVLDYLEPRLFAPLGIEKPTWDTNLEGINLGGYGLRLRTEDIAKLGQLYLQKGRWQGRQLLPTTWVEMATSRQMSNGSNPESDWDQGYGYQFWRCRHNAYRGDGAFGQYCLVLPDQDVVVAITGGLGDMQAVLNRVWEELLPAFSAPLGSHLEQDQKRLSQRLSGLMVRPASGKATSPRAAQVVGRTYRFPNNEEGLESLRLDHEEGKGWIVTRTFRGTEYRLSCGVGIWLQGHGMLGASPRGPLRPLSPEPLAASAAWSSDDTLVVKICAKTTPFHTTLNLKFTGDEVVMDSRTNVGFAGTHPAPLTGQSAR